MIGPVQGSLFGHAPEAETSPDSCVNQPKDSALERLLAFGEYDRRDANETAWRVERDQEAEMRAVFSAARRMQETGRACWRPADTEDYGDLEHEARMDWDAKHAERIGSVLDERRASDYHEHTVNLAGFALMPEEFKKSVRRRWERYQDSIDLANALESVGVEANYTGKPGRPAPYIVCPISRRAIPLPSLRRLNFFPETAAARRSAMLKEVEAYLVANEWARMSTFTSGRRVRTAEIREQHKRLTRRMSKLAAEPWFKAIAELVFRAVEYGTPKLCSRSGDWTWHVHAHTIIRPHRAFPKKRWRKFLRRVRSYMGAQWDAGEPVRKPRELVKYPVKPADLRALLALGGPMEVKAFYEQTLGLRICETLGSLRAQRRAFKSTTRRRHKEMTARGEWVRTVRQNWNARRGPVRRDMERAKRKLAEQRKDLREGLNALAGFCRLPVHEATAPMRNRLVARLSPAPYACRVYEPAALVWNFDGNFEAITAHPAWARTLATVWERTAGAIEDAAEQDAAGVQQRSHQSHNCPAGLEPPALIEAPPDPFRRHLEALLA